MDVTNDGSDTPDDCWEVKITDGDFDTHWVWGWVERDFDGIDEIEEVDLTGNDSETLEENDDLRQKM